METPKEPTADQCRATAKVYESEGQVGYAIWYPQMGGYVGKAIAICSRSWYEDEATGIGSGGCVDMYIWHDGEFPFGHASEFKQEPRQLHHCDPDQFIQFGYALKALNDAHRRAAPKETLL